MIFRRLYSFTTCSVLLSLIFLVRHFCVTIRIWIGCLRAATGIALHLRTLDFLFFRELRFRQFWKFCLEAWTAARLCKWGRLFEVFHEACLRRVGSWGFLSKVVHLMVCALFCNRFEGCQGERIGHHHYVRRLFHMNALNLFSFKCTFCFLN